MLAALSFTLSSCNKDLDGVCPVSHVAGPTHVNDFRPSSFSSRALPGQDLDVTAPRNRIYGPYQTNSGPVGYAAMSGTSMAAPHVAGIVALMVQQKPGLGQRHRGRLHHCR